MRRPPIEHLHDATLEGIEFDWDSGKVVISVKTHEGDATYNFQDVVSLEVPRRHPWGPSVSINEVTDTVERCEIEMQSGDTILIRKKPEGI